MLVVESSWLTVGLRAPAAGMEEQHGRNRHMKAPAWKQQRRVPVKQSIIRIQYGSSIGEHHGRKHTMEIYRTLFPECWFTNDYWLASLNTPVQDVLPHVTLSFCPNCHSFQVATNCRSHFEPFSLCSSSFLPPQQS